jgi:outer membrane protein W
MTKKLLVFTFCILTEGIIFAQTTINPVKKGNKQLGIQLMLAPIDLFWSETALSINENQTRYGLNIAPSVQWFVEDGWSFGLQSNIGFYREKDKNNVNWGYNEKIFDLGITPFSRYYFNVGRNNRFKPFVFAGLPIIYSDVQRTYNNQQTTDYDEQSVELNGTFGGGVAYFGKAGSIEMNISNMGFFIGVSKFSGRKAK